MMQLQRFPTSPTASITTAAPDGSVAITGGASGSGHASGTASHHYDAGGWREDVWTNSDGQEEEMQHLRYQDASDVTTGYGYQENCSRFTPSRASSARQPRATSRPIPTHGATIPTAT
jgi:hypothetical protein